MLSARNQLRGKVKDVKVGNVMGHIVVQVGENEIESVITRRCPASTTFSGQRQLFFPIDDNYKLYECLILG
jgi:molybdopterin-binding protein